MTKSPLKKEAEKIISDLKLLKILKPFGETHLVGSVVLDLIVKLDIDIHVYLGQKNLIKTVNAIWPQLLNHQKVKEIDIGDYRERRSLKLGIDKFPNKSGNWSIDIWLTNDRGTASFDKTPSVLKQLTPARRRTILKLKKYYNKRKLCRNGLSYHIYRAVIDHGVTTIKEFEKLRQKFGY